MVLYKASFRHNSGFIFCCTHRQVILGSKNVKDKFVRQLNDDGDTPACAGGGKEAGVATGQSDKGVMPPVAATLPLVGCLRVTLTPGQSPLPFLKYRILN